jgi:monoamine oxidase
VNAPWKHPKAKEWDQMTAGEWLRHNTVNPAVVNLLECWTQPGFGADVDELSLLFLLWYVACSGDETHKGTFERNSDTADGAQQKRFVGGSQLVPLRLAAHLGDRVALNAPVTRIEQRDGRCHVHSARGTVTAKRVVVACPPPTVLGIQFAPVLPLQRQQLLQQMDMGNLMKCDAVYAKPFWRSAGLNGFGISDRGAVRAAFDNSPPDASVGVLLAFVGGTTWREFGLASAATRRRAVLQGFADLFGEQALHPVDYVEHDWNREAWTRGGPVAVMGPLTLSSYGPWLRRPHGRVHWAGTETSTYWTGYMDGAVRAGQRAGGEVLAGL